MSRPAEEVLEFGRLKEIVGRLLDVRARTARRARRLCHSRMWRRSMLNLCWSAKLSNICAAVPSWDLVRSPIPDAWLGRLAIPALVLSSAELLDAASLMDNVASVKQTFKGEAAKYPRLAASAAALADLRHLSDAIRRAVLPNGEISDDASPQLKRIRVGIGQAREKIRRSLESVMRARGEACRRRLHNAAK